MALSPGTRLGVYEISAPIGAGGMGEVYRATDTKLKRQVAIKILPSSLAADHDRLARFQREAEVLASLNHPHIAGIYGLEERDGVSALVMELVDGEDLSQRIARGAIPIDEALPIAKQIAAALEAAHEQGIIHRDLKPANIKVRADGTVKVLDFGLAKALSPMEREASAARPAASMSPTIMSPVQMSGIGMILGTAAYMAPEQAKGRAVDRRADIWAFGVVLYEMLTAKALFAAEDVSDTLAAVLTRTVDLAALPAATPPQIRRLLARCLARDTRERLDSMAVARFEIDEALRTPMGTMATPSRSGARLVVIAAVLAGAAFALGWIGSRAMTPPAAPATLPTLAADVPAPLETIAAFSKGFALSPDGESLAFAARNRSGLRQIWIRRMGAGTARPVPGTDEGRYPFWSPDGRHIGFFTDNKLRRVPVDGGDPQTLCDVFGLFPSGSWSGREEILFASWVDTMRASRIPAGGGTPTPVAVPHEAIRPVWLPDSRRFLFAGGRSGEDWGIYLAAIDGDAPKRIATLPYRTRDFVYAPDGGFVLMNRSDVLTAQRLDADAGALIGPVATVSRYAGSPYAWFAVSAAADRVVAYVERSPDDRGSPGDPWARLQWVDAQGAMTDTLGEGRFWALSLSPDGQRVATSVGDSLWLVGADRRQTRLTRSGDDMLSPVWSPDGDQIAVSRATAGSGTPEMATLRVDRDSEKVVHPGTDGLPTDWSRDRRWLLLSTDRGSGNRADILLYDLAASTVRDWLATTSSESMGRFSPNGKWIAYASNATGRVEIYLRAFEGSGNPILVSSGGGIHPRWRRDGGELYFLGPGDEMMAVDIAWTGAAPAPGPPRKLFTVPVNDLSIEAFSPYDVAADGKRFLLNVPERPEPLLFLQGLSALVR